MPDRGWPRTPGRGVLRRVVDPTPGAVARDLLAELRARVPRVVGGVSSAVGEAVRGRHARRDTGALRVEVVSTPEALDRLSGAWGRLHAAGGSRSAFASAAWLSGWWHAVGLTLGHTLHVLVASDGDEVVAILPTYRAGGVLRTLGDTWVGSEHLDVIVAPERAAEAAAALARAVAADPAVDALELLDVAEDGALVGALRGEPGLVARADDAWQELPYLPLPGSARAWEASLSGNMRYNVRRKLRRLSEAYPQATLRTIDRSEALPEALELLFRLHALRWQSKGQTGNFVRPQVRAFHHRVGPELLARGVLRLYQLDLGEGRIAATLYCLRSGGRELYLQAGMDPAYEVVSAGFCVMAKVIAAAADDGVTEFDFLRGTEGYKTHWATAQRTTRRLTAARPTPRGLAWLARQQATAEAKAGLKAAVPEAWLSAVRQRLGR